MPAAVAAHLLDQVAQLGPAGVGAQGEDQADALVGGPAGDGGQRQHAGRIGPLDVVGHQQQRTLARQVVDAVEQGVLDPEPVAIGRFLVVVGPLVEDGAQHRVAPDVEQVAPQRERAADVEAAGAGDPPRHRVEHRQLEQLGQQPGLAEPGGALDHEHPALAARQALGPTGEALQLGGPAAVGRRRQLTDGHEP